VLRAAAQAVLAAWDDAPGVENAALAEAIDRLRGVLSKAARARPASGPRAPRTGTKQAAVLALLRGPEGASGPAIAAATGWAPHTVRGFLAGLKKRGVAVLVHERVRQVGPGKDGAKGSYSIYRIAEAG
jgi:predicted ArsR family transcriptional regulator